MTEEKKNTDESISKPYRTHEILSDVGSVLAGVDAVLCKFGGRIVRKVSVEYDRVFDEIEVPVVLRFSASHLEEYSARSGQLDLYKQ